MARILVVSNLFPPHSIGGYEMACRDVVNRWSERGHDVAVLTSDYRRPGAVDAQEEATWRRLPLTWAFAATPPLPRRIQLERAAARCIDDAMSQWQPDLVSVWNMAGVPLLLLDTVLRHAAAVVTLVSDTWPVVAPQQDPWARMLSQHPFVGGAAARAARLPSRVPDLDALGVTVFVSDALRAQCRASTPWSFTRSEIVPLGVNLDDFPLRDDPPSPWDGRLLYVGRLDPTKGVDTLVRAIAEIPDVTLDIIGPAEPTHLERLRALATTLGVQPRVAFESLPRDELAERYALAAAVVFPSEWEEPFGMVPLEAMACATPVIATGTGGAGEFLVDGDNCRVFRAGDATSLAAAIRELAGDGELRARLVAGGRRTAGALTITQTADRLEAIGQQVLADHTNAVR